MALCVELLHRHPYECQHLPISAMVELLAYQMMKADAMKEDR